MVQAEFSLYSEALGTWTPVVALLPETRNADTKLFFLLHGLGCDQRKWSSWINVERYADGRNVALIMPYGQRSFYTDMKHGYKYYTYIGEELPRKIEAMFGLSPDPAKTYIAGYSMGAYGAAKIGFAHPERFAGIGLLSGVLDPDRFNGEWWDADAKLIWGDDYLTTFKGSENDPLVMLDRAVESGKLGKLFHTVGTDDFLYEDNRTFRRAAEGRVPDYRYTEGPGGHDNVFWNSQLDNMFDYFLK